MQLEPVERFQQREAWAQLAEANRETSALYEPPFSHLHSGGPDELFAGAKK